MHHGTNEAVDKTLPVNIVNKERCLENWNEVKAYLLSNGILIHETKQADKTFICLWNPGWLIRALMLTPINGVNQSEGIAWAIDERNTMLHELLHLHGLEHNWRGVMFPFSTPFATGMTEGELKILKEN